MSDDATPSEKAIVAGMTAYFEMSGTNPYAADDPLFDAWNHGHRYARELTGATQSQIRALRPGRVGGPVIPPVVGRQANEILEKLDHALVLLERLTIAIEALSAALKEKQTAPK